uniref:Uncharacterized protein n=1 Tax=Cannabis sativa TaxID=3483 RepID=A0A803Q662_CANSA
MGSSFLLSSLQQPQNTFFFIFSQPRRRLTAVEIHQRRTHHSKPRVKHFPHWMMELCKSLFRFFVAQTGHNEVCNSSLGFVAEGGGMGFVADDGGMGFVADDMAGGEIWTTMGDYWI